MSKLWIAGVAIMAEAYCRLSLISIIISELNVLLLYLQAVQGSAHGWVTTYVFAKGSSKYNFEARKPALYRGLSISYSKETREEGRRAPESTPRSRAPGCSSTSTSASRQTPHGQNEDLDST
jgi:hypothetical protein